MGTQGWEGKTHSGNVRWRFADEEEAQSSPGRIHSDRTDCGYLDCNLDEWAAVAGGQMGAGHRQDAVCLSDQKKIVMGLTPIWDNTTVTPAGAIVGGCVFDVRGI